MIVVQQPSQTLTALDGSAILDNLVLRHDQPIAEALMITFFFSRNPTIALDGRLVARMHHFYSQTQ